MGDTATTENPSELIEDITEDEFEALLDELHGTGGAPGASAAKAPAPAPTPTPAPTSSSGGNEDITDDEFEALLDQLHGQGKGPGVGAPKAEKPAEKPRVKVENTPAEPAKPAGGQRRRKGTAPEHKNGKAGAKRKST